MFRNSALTIAILTVAACSDKSPTALDASHEHVPVNPPIIVVPGEPATTWSSPAGRTADVALATLNAALASAKDPAKTIIQKQIDAVNAAVAAAGVGRKVFVESSGYIENDGDGQVTLHISTQRVAPTYP